MERTTLLGSLADRRHICVMLRADGWNYGEIAAFLGIAPRQARYEIENVVDDFPGLLDHRRQVNEGRALRLLYLLGAADAGAAIEDMPGMLDSLIERADWLRERMAERARRTEDRRSSAASTQ